MTAQITELINTVDATEIVRDKIAVILLEEQAAQQVLATAALQDPRLWALKVFTEASNPWSQFSDTPDQLDATPLVNVSIDGGDYDESGSNVVETQRGIVRYNVDVYGYGVAKDTVDGHTPGDQKSALEALRAYRLVRKILMSGYYPTLALTGTVGKKFPKSFQVFNPAGEDRLPVQHVTGVRLVLEVQLYEQSPQVLAQILEEINVEVRRGETGEIFFTQTTVIPP